MTLSKERLWRILADKNPRFETGAGVAFTPNGLRKFFDTVWDQAHERGIENGRALEKDDADKPFESLFGNVWRKP